MTVSPNIGAKAANLAVLTGHGVDVPPWRALPTELFEQFRAGLEPTALKAAEVPAEIAEQIKAAYAEVGGGYVAVRSSGLEEDGSAHSFAGQFDTYLNVTGADAVVDRVKDCWASAFSERSVTYRATNGLPATPAGMGVLIQRMVSPEVSGVLFTADPISGSRRRFLVSAVYGLGEGIVSGAVDADTAVLDAATGDLLESDVGEKAQRYDGVPDGGVVVTDVPREDQEKWSLEHVPLEELHRAGQILAERFGSAQDVEWAAADGRLWILQSRPITTALTNEPTGELRIWDNSNIVESFRGVTSPLTFTFAAMAYGAVYESFARSLRVPDKQMRQMQEWLPSLLGSFHGRVYYNLVNWYRLQRIPPFYDVNRKLLEVAMGVDEPLPEDIAASLQAFEFDSAWERRRARLVINTTFFVKYFRMSRDVKRFTKYFYESYAVFDNRDYASMPADETYRALQDLHRDLLKRWGPMQMLDQTGLLTLGILSVLGKRWMPDAPEWLTWAAARPGGEIESAEPARALTALAEMVKSDSQLRTIIMDVETPAVPGELAAGGHRAFLDAVDAYVRAHGYRSPDELKLEVPDLREDPASLYVMLRDALDAPPETASTDQAQEYLDQHLRGPRRRLYEVVRRKAARALADRERLRFCRTRAFGSAKQMLRALGRHLQRSGALETFEDVFLLRLDELMGAYEGKIAHDELRDIVAVRRRTQERQHTMVAPPRFETRGAPYWEGNLEAAGWTTLSEARTGAGSLQGTASAPGVVTGRVVVADRPHNVNGGILVTYSTDPGWVAALPSAAGLIIERGSPLTHVAIVARELGVPTIVKVKGATRELETGMTITMDGATGLITVLDPAEVPA